MYSVENFKKVLNNYPKPNSNRFDIRIYSPYDGSVDKNRELALNIRDEYMSYNNTNYGILLFQHTINLITFESTLTLHYRVDAEKMTITYPFNCLEINQTIARLNEYLPHLSFRKKISAYSEHYFCRNMQQIRPIHEQLILLLRLANEQPSLTDGLALINEVMKKADIPIDKTVYTKPNYTSKVLLSHKACVKQVIKRILYANDSTGDATQVRTFPNTHHMINVLQFIKDAPEHCLEFIDDILKYAALRDLIKYFPKRLLQDIKVNQLPLYEKYLPDVEITSVRFTLKKTKEVTN